MSEVKWIKIYVDMFDKKKIKKIRRLPDGDKILLIWIMLLAQAGVCNAGGCIFLTPNIPYAIEDLADELDFNSDTIKLALKAFETLQMISVDEKGYILILNWEKYQNIDGLEKIKEQNRKRVEAHRARKRGILIQKSNVTSNVTVTQSNAIDIDKDRDIDKEYKEIKKEISKNFKTIAPESIEINQIIDFYKTYFKKAYRLSFEQRQTVARITNQEEYSLTDWDLIFKNASKGWKIDGEKVIPPLDTILENHSKCFNDDYNFDKTRDKEEKKEEIKAAEKQQRIEEEAAIKAEKTPEERIDTKEKAIKYLKPLGERFWGVSSFSKELIQKFNLTKDDIREAI